MELGDARNLTQHPKILPSKPKSHDKRLQLGTIIICLYLQVQLIKFDLSLNSMCFTTPLKELK